MKNRTRITRRTGRTGRTGRTRRNIRKRGTQKRIKGAGLYESNPKQLKDMLEKFIHSKIIFTKENMVKAVTEYKTKRDYIDDRDYMALRNYIWNIQYGSHIMAKIPPEKRPPPLKSTPEGVCEEIGEYFFKKKPTHEPTQEELARAFLSFQIK
jgi:hypothetical protein